MENLPQNIGGYTDIFDVRVFCNARQCEISTIFSPLAATETYAVLYGADATLPT